MVMVPADHSLHAKHLTWIFFAPQLRKMVRLAEKLKE